MKKFFKGILIVALIIGTALLSGCFMIALKLSKIDLDLEKLEVNQFQIEVFDQNDKKVDFAVMMQRTSNHDPLPEHVKNAFIAVEDKRFYQHNGIDMKRIFAAIWKNFKERSFSEGASTITQQLIKNTHLTSEKTISRKLKEIALSLKLEKQLSKDEILDRYLNIIYFGENTYGIDAAALTYFGKTPQELTVDEAACLAGLLKAPSRFSPLQNYELCKNRRDIVLYLMKEQGYLTDSDYQTAKRKSIRLSTNEAQNFASSYIKEAFEEARDILKLDEKDFYSSRLRIFTHLKTDAQSWLEEAIFNPILVPNDEDIGVSALSLNNLTHGIEAFVSKESFVSLKTRRQPASTVKPLLVYGPALELGYISPCSPLLDEKVDYSGYIPKNADGKFHGFVSARQALSKSYNIPSVKLLNTIGLNNAIRFGKSLKLNLQEDDASLAWALGGIKNGISSFELAQSYSSIANGGTIAEISMIRQIENVRGDVLYCFQPDEKRVFSESTSYLLTDMLKTTVSDGTAKKMNDLKLDIAAKTGTNGDENGNLDAWCVSFTPLSTLSVWFGSKDSTCKMENSIKGSTLPCLFSKAFYQACKDDERGFSFQMPSGVNRVKIHKESYENDQKILLCPDRADGFFEIFNSNNVPLRFPKSRSKLNSFSTVINDSIAEISFKTDFVDDYFLYILTKEKRELIKKGVSEVGINKILIDKLPKEMPFYFQIEFDKEEKEIGPFFFEEQPDESWLNWFEN